MTVPVTRDSREPRRPDLRSTWREGARGEGEGAKPIPQVLAPSVGGALDQWGALGGAALPQTAGFFST
jgi:hypothetical protein